MNAHWTEGDGWTGALDAARAHREARGTWTGIKGAVGRWLDGEKRRRTGGNRKHELAAGFKPKGKTAWVNRVVAAAQQAYVPTAAAHNAASVAVVAVVPAAAAAVVPAAAAAAAARATSVPGAAVVPLAPLPPPVVHARNLAGLARVMTVKYDVFSKLTSLGHPRYKQGEAKYQVYTARKGALVFNVQGRGKVPAGPRIAVREDEGLCVGESRRGGKLVARAMVPWSVSDARRVMNKVWHTPDAAKSFLENGEVFVQPRGPATEALGIRYRDGVFQVSLSLSSESKS